MLANHRDEARIVQTMLLLVTDNKARSSQKRRIVVSEGILVAVGSRRHLSHQVIVICQWFDHGDSRRFQLIADIRKERLQALLRKVLKDTTHREEDSSGG